MFSDTHFHFEHTINSLKEKYSSQSENVSKNANGFSSSENENSSSAFKNKENGFSLNENLSGTAILSKMAERNTFFGLDIGTDADDLFSRQAAVDSAIAEIKDSKTSDKVRSFMYFSAGIWPGIDDIKNRDEKMKILEKNIRLAENSSDNDTLHRKVIAIGEFGLDHHWNPSGADGRCEDDFSKDIYKGEKILMMMQLELARNLNLPAIIHSRDAFSDTLNCIKEVGYNNGIIHCYSYGAEEAKAFLDLGWHISFSGSVTYAKKKQTEEMLKLLRLVPDDRILCETDSPYLSPVPLRGQTNTPLNIEHTYKFIADARGTTMEKLSGIVDANIKRLFNLAE